MYYQHPKSCVICQQIVHQPVHQQCKGNFCLEARHTAIIEKRVIAFAPTTVRYFKVWDLSTDDGTRVWCENRLVGGVLSFGFTLKRESQFRRY